MAVELVERPLPKPSDEGYVEARLLEALVEARLALRFVGEGMTLNAAGKAFQAWKALLAALLRLELDKLKVVAKTEEEKSGSTLRRCRGSRQPRRNPWLDFWRPWATTA